MIKLRAHATVEPPFLDHEFVGTDIGPDGELLALWTSPSGSRVSGPGWVVDIGRVHRPSIQPLPDGRVLVVESRCRWSSTGVAPNAHVYDQSGQVVASAVFGDGIQHVATTPGGQVWVGYSEDGIYGTLGWGEPEGPRPIGVSGLVRFDENLDLAWEYPSEGRFDEIEDCYALNVAGEVAWACYYARFPVVRIDAGEITGWSTEGAEPKAVISDGYRCALVGGFDEEYPVIFGTLSDDETFEVSHMTELALPEGPVSLTGRGDTLHAVAHGVHYKIDIEQLRIPGGP